MLKPPPRATAADGAEAALFQAIMDGTIPPGAPLRLQDLSNQLGMSMMPIREAVRRLETLALVDVIPHKGAFVRPVSIDDLGDTYFARIHLEAVAIREAARQRISADDGRIARESLLEQKEAFEQGDLLVARHAHERFHVTLYEASGVPWMVQSIWPAWRNSERYRAASMRNPTHIIERQAAQHVAMLDAVESGDEARAVRLLVEHLTTGYELAASTLGSSKRSQPKPLPTVEDLLG
jgi:DNA-binding GntR family transcriptional regulator